MGWRTPGKLQRMPAQTGVLSTRAAEMQTGPGCSISANYEFRTGFPYQRSPLPDTTTIDEATDDTEMRSRLNAYSSKMEKALVIVDYIDMLYG
jgi:hypothetical protein